jgi:hypothetical protein
MTYQIQFQLSKTKVYPGEGFLDTVNNDSFENGLSGDDSIKDMPVILPIITKTQSPDDFLKLSKTNSLYITSQTENKKPEITLQSSDPTSKTLSNVIGTRNTRSHQLESIVQKTLYRLSRLVHLLLWLSIYGEISSTWLATEKNRDNFRVVGHNSFQFFEGVKFA